MNINCSVTVMPVCNGTIGFLRRRKDDSYPELLVAPGGKVESTDGELIESVPYWSAEECAVRELLEEARLSVTRDALRYFCSLTLPNGRVVISFYTIVPASKLTGAAYNGELIWLSRNDIMLRTDFAPGMRTEALLLLDRLCLAYRRGDM